MDSNCDRRNPRPQRNRKRRRNGSDDNEKSEPAKQVAASEPAPKPKPEPPSDEEILDLTIATMKPSSIQTACEAVDTAGYRFGLIAFGSGYQGESGISTKEAFDRILEEC